LDDAAEEAKAPAHWSALALFGAAGEIAELCAAPMCAEARGWRLRSTEQPSGTTAKFSVGSAKLG
jgi:hypothetical protein